MALFNILVDIAARTASFESGMQRVEKRLESFTAGAAKLARSAGGLLGVSVGFEAVRRSVDAAIARGDELQRLSERMDTSAKSLSQLQYVANQSDIPFENLSGSLDTFTKNIGMASVGTGKAQKALQALGIDAKEIARLGLDEQLNLIADAIERIDNPTRQATITTQLFGSADMLSMLKSGSAGIRELREESDRLGYSLENEAARQLAAADEAMKQLNASTTALSSTLAVTLAPILARIATGIRISLQGGIEKNLTGQLNDLVDRRNELLGQQNKLENSWLSKLLLGDDIDAALASVRANLASVETEMNRVNDLLLKRDATANAAAGRKSVASPSFDMFDEAANAASRRFNTMQEFAANAKEFEAAEASLRRESEAAAKAHQDFLKSIDAGASNVSETSRLAEDSIRQLSDRIEDAMERQSEMSEFAKEAARNMQDYFAQYLFDPFDDGLKGMTRGFIDMIRRIAAEVAASKVFEGLGKWGKANEGAGGLTGFLGGLLSSFGGGKAEGGPLQQGKWYIAGERGPEPIWGGGPGAYAMGYGGGGGITVNMPIDMRGATQDAVKLMMAQQPRLIRQAADLAKAEMRDERRRGR